MINYSEKKILDKLNIDFPEWNITIDDSHNICVKGKRLTISYVSGDHYIQNDFKLMEDLGLELAIYVLAFRQIEKHIAKVIAVELEVMIRTGKED